MRRALTFLTNELNPLKKKKKKTKSKATNFPTNQNPCKQEPYRVTGKK